jgi:hypothetical protein
MFACPIRGILLTERALAQLHLGIGRITRNAVRTVTFVCSRLPWFHGWLAAVSPGWLLRPGGLGFTPMHATLLDATGLSNRRGAAITRTLIIGLCGRVR